MKYHKQQILATDLGGGKGSCYPTAIACLLDAELIEVPLFNLFYFDEKEVNNLKKVFSVKYLHGKELQDAEEHERRNFEYNFFLHSGFWDKILQMFLASKGYSEQYISTEDYENWLKNHPDQPYMVTGMSPRGILHVVIFQNGEMIHDPHPSNDGVAKEGRTYSYLIKL